jgi:DNA-binding NtrC family response regulator
MAETPSDRALLLLVEEETDVRTDIEALLLRAGFDVLSAADTDEASAYLEDRREIQGVVVDAHAPGRVDGSGFVHHVRASWPDLVVVMMSGHSDSSSGELPAGSLFISKPNLLEHLVPALRRHLGGKP